MSINIIGRQNNKIHSANHRRKQMKAIIRAHNEKQWVITIDDLKNKKKICSKNIFYQMFIKWY